MSSKSILVANPLSAAPIAASSPRRVTGVFGEGGYDEKMLAVWPPAPPAPRPALYEYATFAVLRLRILAQALPLALLVILIRWLNIKDGGAEAPVEAVVLPPLITAAVFVIATVLSNVMADYKESEKLPAELVSYFNTLVAFARAEATAHDFDELPMLRNAEEMLLCVIATLDQKIDFKRCLDTFHEAFVAYCVYAQGQGEHDGQLDLLGPEHAVEELVKKWARIHDIGRLSIILPGYTLMDLLTLLLVALFASVKFIYIDASANWAIVIFATIVIYLNFLVRALDNPFDGPEEYHYRCYVHGSTQRMTLWESFNFGLGINFESLTVDFGSILRRLVHEHGTLPAPGALARGGGGHVDGQGAKQRRSLRMAGSEQRAAAAPPPQALAAGGKPLVPPGWTYSISATGETWWTDPSGKTVWAV